MRVAEACEMVFPLHVCMQNVFFVNRARSSAESLLISSRSRTRTSKVNK